MTDTTKYIVIQCSAWCNSTGCGLDYSSDLEEFEKRDKAIKHGFKVQESDDFNIGVVTNGKLVSLDWMAESLGESAETLAEIAEQIGLEEAV